MSRATQPSGLAGAGEETPPESSAITANSKATTGGGFDGNTGGEGDPRLESEVVSKTEEN